MNGPAHTPDSPHPHLGKPCESCGKPNDGGRMQPGNLPHSNYPLRICKACKAEEDRIVEAQAVAIGKAIGALLGRDDPDADARLAKDIANAPPEKKRGCVIYTGNENGVTVDRKATAEILGIDEDRVCFECGEPLDDDDKGPDCPDCALAKDQEAYADDKRKGLI